MDNTKITMPCGTGKTVLSVEGSTKLIHTYKPGEVKPDDYDFEEYCPHCDSFIPVRTYSTDEYETVCPVCGKRLMLCTLCRDVFGDTCDWNDKNDCKCHCVKRCSNCKWHEDFTGACCNGDSDYRADFTDSDFVCDKWEERKNA